MTASPRPTEQGIDLAPVAPRLAEQYARRTVTVDIDLYRLSDGEIKRQRVRGLWIQFGLLAFVLVALLVTGGGPF